MESKTRGIGRIIKASRVMAGNGLRGFANAIGLQPSRMSDIEVGSPATDAELDLIAAEIERTWQAGIAWRERIVAERDALTEENAKLKDVIKAIKSCEWFNEDDLDNTDNPFTMVGCNSLRKAFALLDK